MKPQNIEIRAAVAHALARGIPFETKETFSSSEVEAFCRTINTKFADALDWMKRAQAEITKTQGDSKEARELVEKLQNQISRLEAKGNRRPDGTGLGTDAAMVMKTIQDSPGWSALKGGQPTTGRIALPGSLKMLTKALTSTQAGGSPNDGYQVVPQRWDGISEDPRRILRLLDVLPHIQVTSNTFEYMSLGNYTAAADVQAGEGIGKAQGNLPLTLQSSKIVTVAHYMKASRQVLDDVPMLQRYLSDLLTYGVNAKVENLIVANADPTKGILGLLAPDIAGTLAPTAAAAADRISEGIAALSALGWNPSVVILHPTYWHKIRTERATTGDGQYIAGPGWNQPPTPSIWGLPVVTTPSMALNTALVADAGQVLILDRQQTAVQIGYDGSDFTNNLVTLLGECRVGFAPLSNGALLKVPLP